MIRVREGLRLAGGRLALEIGIVRRTRGNHATADQAAIKKRQLGVDAGDRAVAPGTPTNPERHALREDEVKDPILRGLTRQPLSDGTFDLLLVLRALDLVAGAGLQADDVLRRNGAGLRVACGNRLGRWARGVDDEQHVGAVLRVHGGSQDEENRKRTDCGAARFWSRDSHVPPRFHMTDSPQLTKPCCCSVD